MLIKFKNKSSLEVKRVLLKAPVRMGSCRLFKQVLFNFRKENS